MPIDERNKRLLDNFCEEARKLHLKRTQSLLEFNNNLMCLINDVYLCLSIDNGQLSLEDEQTMQKIYKECTEEREDLLKTQDELLGVEQ